MATQNRRSATGLIDQARAQPYRFEFFQLVRLLRLHYSRAGRIDPETRPHDDPLRFRSQLSLAFPVSEVSELKFERAERTNANDQPLSEVQVTFMGQGIIKLQSFGRENLANSVSSLIRCCIARFVNSQMY